MATTTKHTCGGPVFGRKTAGCRRCGELLAGAKPVVWSQSRTATHDAQRCESIRRHFASHQHLSGGRGPVCTFGEW